MLTLLLLVSPALALCDRPSDVSSISVDVSTAQLAMASLDDETFAASVRDARATLLCLATPLNPLDASSYHVLMALDAFMGGKPEDSARSFRTVLAISPTFRLPAAIAPAGGPLEKALDAARAQNVSEPQALPAYDGIVLIDGVRALVRPTGRPCILQLVTTKGVVSATYYLGTDDELPRWAPPPTALQKALPKVRSKPSVPFAIAAGATAAAAVAIDVYGSTRHDAFLDPATPYDQLDALRVESDGSLAASIGLGVASAALTTFTFLRW